MPNANRRRTLIDNAQHARLRAATAAAGFDVKDGRGSLFGLALYRLLNDPFEAPTSKIEGFMRNWLLADNARIDPLLRTAAHRHAAGETTVDEFRTAVRAIHRAA